jgi:hypothetical protein
MTHKTNTLLGLAASCTIACVSVLACFWPSETQADDAESAVAAEKDIGRNTTRIGKILATTHLVRDEKAKSQWFIEIEVTNTNPEGRETAELDEEVLRTTFESMGRVASSKSTVAWRSHEKVDMMPGEKLVLRHALPAALASQLTASVRPSAGQPNGPMVMNGATYEIAITDPSRMKGPEKSRLARSRAVANRQNIPNVF